MRLLEIVRGKASSKEVIATCMQLSKKLGKVGVLVGNCRGFVGNRMFGPYRREAQFLVEEGATASKPWTRRCTTSAWPWGRWPSATLPGSTSAGAFAKNLSTWKNPASASRWRKIVLCEMGRYGQKTGAGWYKYDENRRAISDPDGGRKRPQVGG